MEGPTVQVSADSVNLSFSGEDIEIFVQCTDTFCLIPVILNKTTTIFNISPRLMILLIPSLLALFKYLLEDFKPQSILLPALTSTQLLPGIFSFQIASHQHLVMPLAVTMLL